MASHHSASQWRTWIAQCEQSDLTVARFCQSIGVSVNTYYRWRQRLQREALACESAAAEFVSIALPSSQIEIEMPGGAVARVCNDRQSLRPLVEQQLGTGAVARVGATVRDNHGCPQVLPSAGPH